MTTNTYTIKALESYRYDKEECLEALGYALAYDENNAVALCLMGRIQMEMFENFELAANYFENALASDATYAETYRHYLELLITQGNLTKAKAFLKFASTRIAHKQAELFIGEARILEREFKFKKALKMLRDALKSAYSEYTIEEIDEIKNRIERKQKCRV